MKITRIEECGEARIDEVTGKMYNSKNIPLNRVCACESNGVKYNIVAQGEPGDYWYNGRFLGTNYAIFMKAPNMMFWQQISPWYAKYGNAERFMLKRARELEAKLDIATNT